MPRPSDVHTTSVFSPHLSRLSLLLVTTACKTVGCSQLGVPIHTRVQLTRTSHTPRLSLLSVAKRLPRRLARRAINGFPASGAGTAMMLAALVGQYIEFGDHTLELSSFLDPRQLLVRSSKMYWI